MKNLDQDEIGIASQRPALSEARPSQMERVMPKEVVVALITAVGAIAATVLPILISHALG